MAKRLGMTPQMADEDLAAVQKIPRLPENIKKAATQRRERSRSRTSPATEKSNPAKRARRHYRPNWIEKPGRE